MPEQPQPSSTQALDLVAGIPGAAPLFLLPEGGFGTTPKGPPPLGMAAREALVTAARWVSTRRTSTFDRLFAPSPLDPDRAKRTERLSVAQGGIVLAQVKSALTDAAATGAAALRDPLNAAQVRSAAITVLSHLVATALRDPDFRPLAEAAAQEIFATVDAETGKNGRPALRGHAINLLQLRGPALTTAQKARAKALLRSLVRAAPPYDELKGPWRFAMCSDPEFHEGECQSLVKAHKFTEVPLPPDAPAPPSMFGGAYRAFQAPFRTPEGQPVLIFARSAGVSDENREMGKDYFIGLLINRHAQLGSFDLRAATVQVKQSGYKLMMNSQCAGLTTRFAIARLFPEADIYSSWDSTLFTESAGVVNSSEGQDCFIGILQGMSKKESHAQLERRIRDAQWRHDVEFPGFTQFIGPAHAQVLARFEDVNQDGKADLYDGFLDFYLKDVAEDVRGSATPRDPGVPASQVGGEAAAGIDWSAGSLNRVTKYSDLWSTLPGKTEALYAFGSGGFYSHREPPADVPTGSHRDDLGRLPSVCRYSSTGASGRITAEVLVHSFLSHAGKEYKRLLCAAEAMTRAFDLGHLPARGPLATPLGQRGAVLLTLAGLLEFPADANFLDGLWSAALRQLNFPEISRSLVRACITSADHDADNYYGGVRSLRQLVGDGNDDKGDLGRADAVVWARLNGKDPEIGRARPLALEVPSPNIV